MKDFGIERIFGLAEEQLSERRARCRRHNL
jgi:hypothetical protein